MTVLVVHQINKQVLHGMVLIYIVLMQLQINVINIQDLVHQFQVVSVVQVLFLTTLIGQQIIIFIVLII